ncbi:MAG: UDP-glucose/GDP-mannose dehydrogenase family protein [Myxococcales bacterium]|nr:UDP-glucose/GDP-mannose dehydrogenase family protein [Myxococcales bacterium]MCB9732284.1 UDP-glucose/GDP-mannose dehydrogenase family protein [Deltaproteobacteria bacterium]
MNVAVVGTGYVGLVAGACFAELGHRVTCVDNDPKKLEVLRGGGIPIYEPGLEEMVPRNVQAGRLTFTSDLAAAVQGSDVIFIAVGTPPGGDGSADLRAVTAVAEEIAGALNGYKVIVMKSTVPIGTGDRVKAIITSLSKEEFSVVSNPEFLREGVAVDDFMRPDRIVVGASEERAVDVMRKLYRPLTREGAKLMVMDIRSSEMTKYASNAMLATRISFVNEVSRLCDVVGADIENVRRGMGADTRIGEEFLRAGVGFGGSCFPKDVRALLQSAREYNVELGVVDAVFRANELQKQRMVDVIQGDFGESLAGRRFAMWGLAFKARTDDMREAPSITIARGLIAAGAEVVAYDPEAHETAHAVLGDTIQYAADAYAAVEGADALVLVTDWAAFTSPDWERVWALMREPNLYDGRNLWEPRELTAMGFRYRGIGRR